MEIEKLLIPSGKTPSYAGEKLTELRGVIIHNTDNFQESSSAKAHAQLQYGGYYPNAKASWHYTVDENEIWQSLPDNMKAYSTGAALANNYNISIEICVNSKEGFKKACENAAWLCRELMKKYGLTADNITQHYDWTKKDCPSILRAGAWGITWEEFMNMVNKSDDLTVDEAIKTLVIAGVVKSPDYWKKAADVVKNLDSLLIKMAVEINRKNAA